MKRVILSASILALAACSQAEETDVVDEAEAPEETVAMAIDGQPAAGKYRVTDADGTVYMYEAKADGTYESIVDGEVFSAGVWDQPTPDQYCSQENEEFVGEDEDGERSCSTESYNEDGEWISTDADGNVVTVERVDG